MFEVFLIYHKACPWGLPNPHQDVFYFMLPLIQLSRRGKRLTNQDKCREKMLGDLFLLSWL